MASSRTSGPKKARRGDSAVRDRPIAYLALRSGRWASGSAELSDRPAIGRSGSTLVGDSVRPKSDDRRVQASISVRRRSNCQASEKLWNSTFSKRVNMTASQSNTGELRCMICGGETASYFTKRFLKGDVRGVQEVRYRQCRSCGFSFSATHYGLSPEDWGEVNRKFHQGAFEKDDFDDDPRWHERMSQQCEMLAHLNKNGVFDPRTSAGTTPTTAAGMGSWRTC